MDAYMILMIVVFVLGYFFIATEHTFKINKSATALLLAVLMWTSFTVFSGVFHPGTEEGHERLIFHLGDTAEILFFLLGAMTIVETIDQHGGFSIITDRIATKSKKKLLWVIAILTFFMSAVLDNLTTSIVMVALLRKLIADKKDRWFFGGVVILAANAGGAWSPIGDVTTIMLWIKGNISAGGVIMQTFIPSLICMVVPVFGISMMLKGEIGDASADKKMEVSAVSKRQSIVVLCVGVGSLLFTPVFKTITHLPPYMGILLGLGILWVLTELMHKHNPEVHQRMNIGNIITRVDTPSVLFFLGILMAVAALAEAGHLKLLAEGLATLGGWQVTDILIGALSSIVDNVPLVAAAMGMYDIAPSGVMAMDGPFWEFLAYCAGTGGSLLIIGSAAGVAVMGMEKIDFMWYLKNISIWALLGYLAGAGSYILMHMLLF
ncbi:MAG: sodium:proton antiporter NhaD [Bacteroidales bacterium]|nr:sodium:proton antiporter NhaD [Candidatus Scybalousia scybalohippi]